MKFDTVQVLVGVSHLNFGQQLLLVSYDYSISDTLLSVLRLGKDRDLAPAPWKTCSAWQCGAMIMKKRVVSLQTLPQYCITWCRTVGTVEKSNFNGWGDIYSTVRVGRR